MIFCQICCFIDFSLSKEQQAEEEERFILNTGSHATVEENKTEENNPVKPKLNIEINLES